MLSGLCIHKAGKYTRHFLTALFLLLLSFATTISALELGGATWGCHDPSTMVLADNKYWIYSTADSLNLRSSTDLVHWQWEKKPFAFNYSVPDWMVTYLSPNDATPDDSVWNLWAPDVIKSDSKYFLFYSRNCGTFPDEQSVCGVATSSSISSPSWADQGAVVNVDLSQSHYRAIDPALIFDQSGKLWMAVGSFGSPDSAGYVNGGIRIFQLNTSTGKLASSGDTGKRLAGPWIEAPYLWYHNNYYYLFFNQQTCCAGKSSKYYIRVGRSSSVNGSYIDKDGTSLTSDGGSLFMGLDYSANYPSDVAASNIGSLGRELGPGHVGILKCPDSIERYTYHYYDNNTTGGEPTLGLRSMIWGDDGWPRMGWDLPDGNYAIGSCLMSSSGAPSGGMYLEVKDGNSETPWFNTWTGALNQVWTITHVDTNQYRITSPATGLSLAIAGTDISGTGKQITLATYSADNKAFRWRLTQSNNRSFAFVNASSGTAIAIPGSALTPTALQTATFTNQSEALSWITPAGVYKIKNQWSSKYAQVANSSASTQIGQLASSDNEYQKWRLVPTNDGYTRIINFKSAMSVNLDNSSTADNAKITQQTSAVSDPQKWSFEFLPDSSWRIINKTTGKVLDNASQSDNNYVYQRRWLSLRNQQWSISLLTQIPYDVAIGVQDRGSRLSSRPVQQSELKSFSLYTMNGRIINTCKVQTLKQSIEYFRKSHVKGLYIVRENGNSSTPASRTISLW